MTPNLDHIEAIVADAESGHWCSVETQDLRALVEVARAAQAALKHMEHYPTLYPIEGVQELSALRAALSRLNQKPA